MRILGIRIDEVDMAAALDFIAAAISNYPQDGRLRQVITLNPEGIYLAQQNADFAALAEAADLVTADGTGVLWAAQKLGQPLPERVTGIDLLQQLCARAAREGWSVYLLGAQPGVAEEAAAKLGQAYTGLRVAGTHHGYFRGEDVLPVIRQINAAAPQILFVALGMPAQERFIAAYSGQIQAAVAIGVGGSLDVLAGRVKRAPRLMRRLRLEWLWRLLRQPSRLPRMLAIPKFMRLVKKQAGHQQQRGGGV